ncbi:hypothetical protein [Pedobacter insulae]|uniref:Uncharacterized protein n=1 Tax=Pedobacter insulae TaxID=414048 RepID=A0A1I2XYN9_9SPHI|nr:hypothetical protein [Pedobacter insulae]SFH18620.1 hypothetical protein SAMN04489864_106127 [Pedobacter insulae]
MKNFRSKFIRNAIVAFFGMTIVVSCEKQVPENDLVQVQINKGKSIFKREVDVDSLKLYLGQLLGKDTSEIRYDGLKEAFIANEIGEISNQKLIELYKSHPIIIYKNGEQIK